MAEAQFFSLKYVTPDGDRTFDGTALSQKVFLAQAIKAGVVSSSWSSLCEKVAGGELVEMQNWPDPVPAKPAEPDEALPASSQKTLPSGVVIWWENDGVGGRNYFTDSCGAPALFWSSTIGGLAEIWAAIEIERSLLKAQSSKH